MNDNNGYWYSVSDTMRHLGVSRRTVERRIKDGVYPSKRTDDNRRLVYLDDASLTDNTPPINATGDVTALKKQNDFLCQQNDVLLRQVEQLTQDLAEQNKRHDSIIMAMTQQQQALTEERQQIQRQLEDKRKTRKWWRWS